MKCVTLFYYITLYPVVGNESYSNEIFPLKVLEPVNNNQFKMIPLGEQLRNIHP